MKVTIQISESDFVDMVSHFAKEKLGRPMVAVYEIVSAECEGETFDKGQVLDSYEDGSFDT